MTTKIKERPILFSSEMVRAILDGRKTQTRRVVKDQTAFRDKPDGMEWWAGLMGWQPVDVADPPLKSLRCPYGQPGERLWVRETWMAVDTSFREPVRFERKNDRAGKPHTIVYRADGDMHCDWRPSIHMPRWASRLTLDIADVRVERLQDISDADAVSEGAPDMICSQEYGAPRGLGGTEHDHRFGFQQLWNDINRKRHPWSSNPWVWAITFKRVEDAAQ
jgi:hypothetical protein